MPPLPAPALDRLSALACEHGVTVGLAVIPAVAQPSLAPWLESVRAEVLQHGWAHRSHSAEGEKKMELGPHRAPDIVMDELSKGAGRLRGLAGERESPGARPPVEPDRFGAALGSPACRIRWPVGVRSPLGGGAGPGPEADELPRRRGGLAGAGEGSSGATGRWPGWSVILRRGRRRSVDPAEPTGAS